MLSRACVRLALASVSLALGCELYVPLDDYLGERPDASASLDAHTEDADGEAGITLSPAEEGGDTGAADQAADRSTASDSNALDVTAETAPRAIADSSGQPDRVDALAEVSTPGVKVDSASPPRDAVANTPEAATRDASLPCDGASCGSAVSLIGCSDGTREAFVDKVHYPAIAGCEALWPAGSMRAAPTGVACGNSLGRSCAVPANACAAGWHVCAIPPYGGKDVSAKVTTEACAAELGAFAAGIADQNCDTCVATGDGAGAACCGEKCVPQNGSCIFPNTTRWFGVINEYTNRCDDIRSENVNKGVLCCRTP